VFTVIETIARSVEFIENNLQRDISIADIADSVSYSIYHFCRTFNRVTHHTPVDYLMRRRLSESAKDLLVSNRKIIEVGLDYQFNSPEVYSRAFKRLFDRSPMLWRAGAPIYPPRIMPRLTVDHLHHLNQGDYLRPQIVQVDTLHLVGLMTLVKDETRVIDELWETLFRINDNSHAPDNTEHYYGLSIFPEWQDDRGYFYMAGFVDNDWSMAQEMVLVEKFLPASRYVKFVHKGSYDKMHLSRDYIYHTWLPKSGFHLEVFYEVEKIPGGDLVEGMKTTAIEILLPIV